MQKEISFYWYFLISYSLFNALKSSFESYSNMLIFYAILLFYAGIICMYFIAFYILFWVMLFILAIFIIGIWSCGNFLSYISVFLVNVSAVSGVKNASMRMFVEDLKKTNEIIRKRSQHKMKAMTVAITLFWLQFFRLSIKSGKLKLKKEG